MRSFLVSLSKNRRLLKDLVRRDLKARYVGSSMGFFWSIVFPIINLFVYMFVFRLVLNTRWSDHQGTTEVALLMLAGIMVWQAFAESTSRMTNTLVENSNLIQKVVFPAEVLPVYLTVSALINMLIGLAVALLGVVYFAYVRPDAGATANAQPLRVFASSAARPARGDGLFFPASFRCASNAATTRYTATSVVDESATAWNQPFQGAGPREAGAAIWGDLVYAADGSWAEVRVRSGTSFAVDAWRAADGTPRDPPRDGTLAVVISPPERPLGLGIALVCLPLLIGLQAVFMLGLGAFLSTFNLFLRDTFHVIGVLLTVWMFSTPIFYPAGMVEKQGFGWLLAVNPMYWLVDSYREVLIYGDWPRWGLVGAFAVSAAAMLCLGASFFMSQKPRFPDLL